VSDIYASDRNLLKPRSPQLDQYWNWQNDEHEVSDDVQHSCIAVSEVLLLEVVTANRVLPTAPELGYSSQDQEELANRGVEVDIR
jgi:hypothetical protein